MGSTKICSKKRLCGAEDAGRLMAALSGAAHGSLSGEGGSVKTTAGPALEPVQSLPRFARRGAGRIASRMPKRERKALRDTVSPKICS